MKTNAKRRLKQSLKLSFLDDTLIALALVTALFCTLLQFDLSEVFRLDRSEHLLISMALITLFLSFNPESASHWALSIVVCLAIGFCKEFIDPQMEWGDLVANVVGMKIGMMIFIASRCLTPKLQMAKA